MSLILLGRWILGTSIELTARTTDASTATSAANQMKSKIGTSYNFSFCDSIASEKDRWFYANKETHDKNVIKYCLYLISLQVFIWFSFWFCSVFFQQHKNFHYNSLYYNLLETWRWLFFFSSAYIISNGRFVCFRSSQWSSSAVISKCSKRDSLKYFHSNSRRFFLYMCVRAHLDLRAVYKDKNFFSQFVEKRENLFRAWLLSHLIHSHPIRLVLCVANNKITFLYEWWPTHQFHVANVRKTEWNLCRMMESFSGSLIRHKCERIFHSQANDITAL